jgi:hypothetical protein
MAMNTLKSAAPLRTILWISGMAFIFSLFSSPCFCGEKITSFSGDWVFMAPDGNVSGTSKLYVIPEGYRIDGMPWGGQHGMPRDLTIIGLKDKNRQYIYNHEKKLVYESELDEQEMMDLLKSYEHVDSEKVLGKENVSGYGCVKKKVTTTITTMGMKHSITQTIWLSERFEMPLRVQGEEGEIAELQNINTGKPPAKSFKPLVGYTRVDNMMAVYGMDFSGMYNEQHEEPEKEPAQEDADPKEMMAALEQMMKGQGLDPEQMAQMREGFSHALQEAQSMDTGAGAAGGLWEVIPQRSGDQVGSELKTGDIYMVVLGSQSSFEDVCQDYEKLLTSRNWQKGGGYIQGGNGFLMMIKEGLQLMVSSADDPGLDGDFKTFYSLELIGGRP